MGSNRSGNKLPQDLDIEELLKALESNEEVIEYKNDTLKFIATFDLRPGKFKFKKPALYKLYKRWSKDPVGKVQFFSELSAYIPEDIRYWYISIAPFKITEAVYKLIDAHKVNERTTSPHFKRHFESFLKYYDLKPGTNYHPCSKFYYYYDIWTYGNHSRNPQGYRNFQKFMKIYFQSKRVHLKSARWFGIDKQIITTEENDIKAEAWSKKYDLKNQPEKRKKERNKKIEESPSSARSGTEPEEKS